MAKKYSVHTDAKTKLRVKRHLRIRKKVFGTSDRPRLCVTRSNKRLLVQMIDDLGGVTLLSASTPAGVCANVEKAQVLGKEVASKALAAGIAKCVFDRGGYIYHGKIAAVAQGVRDGGLSV